MNTFVAFALKGLIVGSFSHIAQKILNSIDDLIEQRFQLLETDPENSVIFFIRTDEDLTELLTDLQARYSQAETERELTFSESMSIVYIAFAAIPFAYSRIVFNRIFLKKDSDSSSI